MSDFAFHTSNRDPLHDVRDEVPGFIFYLTQAISIMVAVLPTTVSLGIATYAAWLRGGTLAQRLMLVGLAGVATLYVHAFLPMRWRALSVSTRVVGGLVWCFGVLVVMYGQATFIVASQWEAGNQRAASVPVTPGPEGADVPPGRSLTEIARDAARASADLALVESRRCIGDCRTLTSRKTILSAQVAALNTEADEAKRREAEEDRRNEQADRIEALRATLRASPVAALVALRLGTTEATVELAQAIACAVVLEGAAIMGWLSVSVSLRRPVGRASVASDDHQPVVSVQSVASDVTEPVVRGQPVSVSDPVEVVPESALPVADAAVVVPVGECVEEQANVGPLSSEDDELLTIIHKEVVDGRLKPTQKAIRDYIGRGQPEACRLRRLYVARFGRARA